MAQAPFAGRIDRIRRAPHAARVACQPKSQAGASPSPKPVQRRMGCAGGPGVGIGTRRPQGPTPVDSLRALPAIPTLGRNTPASLGGWFGPAMQPIQGFWTPDSAGGGRLPAKPRPGPPRGRGSPKPPISTPKTRANKRPPGISRKVTQKIVGCDSLKTGNGAIFGPIRPPGTGFDSPSASAPKYLPAPP
jgi:hypothetical protein